MKRLIWLVDMSLDGFMSGPNGELDWAGADMDEEQWAYVNALLGTVDAALFGRATYQNFESYWPSAGSNPASTKNEVNFSHWIEETEKIVASTTLHQLVWKNSKLLNANVLEGVAKVKEGSGKDIVMFGSCNFALHLFEAGLIDALQIRTHPVVLGVGRPLFRHESVRHRLKLVQSRTFGSGVVALLYNTA